jgi:hypothetical protein
MNTHESTVEKYAVTGPYGSGHDRKALRGWPTGQVQTLGMDACSVEGFAHVGANLFQVPGYGYKRFGGAGKEG